MTSWDQTLPAVSAAFERAADSGSPPDSFVFCSNDKLAYIVDSAVVAVPLNCPDAVVNDTCSNSSVDATVTDCVIPRVAVRAEALLEDSAGEATTSKEEELLRERLRCVASGITSFRYHAPTDQLLIPYASNLYYCSLAPLDVAASFKVNSPKSQPNSWPGLKIQRISRDPQSAALLDGQWSPDGDLVAFVCARQLWITQLDSNQQLRVSEDPVNSSVSAGVAEFVMQEEFHRFTGTLTPAAHCFPSNSWVASLCTHSVLQRRTY